MCACPVCNNAAYSEIGIKDGHRVVRCEECRLYFLNPMPTDSEVSEIYDVYDSTEKYLRKKRKKVFTAQHKIRVARKNLEIPGRRFIDIGCNIGAVAEAARRQGFDAHGIDLDGPTVEQAKQLFPENHYETASTFDLAERGEKFDLIFCLEVIEHVPQAHAFVDSIRQVMSPGAILYLTTPDAGHRKVPANFLQWSEVFPPEHLAWYDRNNISQIFEAHDLHIIRFRPCLRANLRVIARAGLPPST